MSGDIMSKESTINRINDVIKGLASIRNKQILEDGSKEDWSLGIGIELLNDYKNQLTKKDKEPESTHNKIPSQYSDFSKDKKYTYDIYEIKDDEETFICRYMDLSLNDVIYTLISYSDKNNEVYQSDDFEDWYYLQDNTNNILYRIQLFQ